MKRFIKIICLCLVFCLLVAGCSGKPEEQPKPDNTENQQEDENIDNPAEEKKVLVVYFSASGNTKRVAEIIASALGADIYEIVPQQAYTSADLNWHDNSSRTTIEQNDKSSRPAISSGTVDLSKYSTVYIGFPIWWGEEPRIMDTFVESHGFTGITVIPFCTSSSSGMGRSGKNLESLAKSGTWLDGRRFSENAAESEIKAWVNS